MSKTRVVHVADNVPDAIYIGRAMPRLGLKQHPLHNPYKIGRDGTRRDVLNKYRADVGFRCGRVPAMHAALKALAGKPLACWCRHDGEARTDDNACHGDVICGLIRELGIEPEDHDGE